MPSGRGHGGHQKGWDYIYKDANKEFGSGTLGWGPLVTQGEFDLTYNLFMIDRPAQGYAENQFEVVYHDKNRTRIRLVPERDDRTSGGATRIRRQLRVCGDDHSLWCII